MSWLIALALATVTAPYPASLSQQARDGLAANDARPPAAADLSTRRARSEDIQRDIGARQTARYGVSVSETVIAGVPVRIFTPKGGARHRGTLLNLHGGGFVVDSGSLTENIPVAALTKRKVVAVLYRLSPEHRFPAAVDDALAVYRALSALPGDRPVGIYGTSAGAILSVELIARLRQEKLRLPIALGFFSGTADFAELGDSVTLFLGPGAADGLKALYAGALPPGDPGLSPARGNLSGWPATLCVSSSRDFLLSATSNFCRRLGNAGVDARLIVHDGLPHAFWSYIEAPESDEAFAEMAHFLNRQLERNR